MSELGYVESIYNHEGSDTAHYDQEDCGSSGKATKNAYRVVLILYIRSSVFSYSVVVYGYPRDCCFS